MGSSRPLAQRFAEKVAKGTPDECWPWIAGQDSDGYGKIGDGGKTLRSNVVALSLASGELASGRHALHSCDHPWCCNPAHLRWGHNEENVRDRQRRRRGVIHIAPEVRERIKVRYAELQNYCAVSREFGYCNQTIRRVVLYALKG